MPEPIDIAVDLGAVPPALPGIVSLREFAATPPLAPPQIIRGVLHRGCKMILGGTSKSNKSWGLLELALSAASGQEWWGHRCEKVPVMRVATDLNPDALRRPQSNNKKCTDKEFLEQFLDGEPQSTAAICDKAEKAGISRRTAERYLKNLKESGVIACEYGLYWRKEGRMRELRHSATCLIKERRNSRRQAEGKTTLLGVGWFFPHCHGTDGTGGKEQ